MTKKCYKCNKTLPIDSFHKNKSRPDGLTDECKECIKIIGKKRYSENRLIRISQATERYYKNKDRISIIRKESYKDNISSWSIVIPEITVCMICTKEIYLVHKDKNNVINFDHRHGGSENIKGSPRNWLNKNKPTDENIAIWKLCDFGYLCYSCNLLLPTTNRLPWLVKALEYAKE